MKIREKIIKEQEYVLEIFDISIIKECLNYCYHRIKKHNKFTPEILEHIQRLRKEFGIIK
jgi:hypothetical protein